ncbi:DUF433 domain-containing protein [candidate division KSB1 bacterium]|nr:DUF433 domain-containing protein [candidate division KSB1 bacterium]MBL7093392.1 DUF433 domain-containing protein [candidate division KSB1 bacterium]
MELVETCYEHITFDSKDVPIIAGTKTKVIELVVERLAYGWSPEEIHFQHRYLTLGQIYSALAYYADHSVELDKDINKRLDKAEKFRETLGISSLAQKLKSKGQK